MVRHTLRRPTTTGTADRRKLDCSVAVYSRKATVSLVEIDIRNNCRPAAEAVDRHWLPGWDLLQPL